MGKACRAEAVGGIVRPDRGEGGGDAVIEVSNLRKKYGDIEALKGVSFHVRAGEIYGLLGPNGAGKSTTIGVLSALSCRAGRASLDGIDIARRSVDARRILGVVPGSRALPGVLGPRQPVVLRAPVRARRRAAVGSRRPRAGQGEPGRPLPRADRALLRRHAAAPQHRRRAAARAEGRVDGRATVGLDPQSRASILELVRSIAAAGAAIVYTTHYLDEAERLCDRIGIIDHGAFWRKAPCRNCATRPGPARSSRCEGRSRPRSSPARCSGTRSSRSSR